MGNERKIIAEEYNINSSGEIKILNELLVKFSFALFYLTI